MADVVHDPLIIPPGPSEGACAALEADIAGREDRGALFLKGLTPKGRATYCRIIASPMPPAPIPPVPDILTASLEDIELWLFAVWQATEEGFDDPDAKTMPFYDWLELALEDDFSRHHLHARFFLSETEPELPLWG